MRALIIGVLVAILVVDAVLTLPAGSPSDDAEIIAPRRGVTSRANSGGEATDTDSDFNDFKGVIDTGVGYPFLQPNPLPLSFNLGFFDSFEDIFRRLRARLWPLQLSGDNDGDAAASEEGIGLPFDPKKGNTTSTVKVVDGHKVEVNETVYGDGANVFRVRVVNIRPVESGEDVEQKSGLPGSDNSDNTDERREPLEEKPDDNEIRRNIDDPESTLKHISSTIPPTALYITTTIIPDYAANLNVAFVTDNTLPETTVSELEGQINDSEEKLKPTGNVEAETNKSAGSVESRSNNKDKNEYASRKLHQSEGRGANIQISEMESLSEVLSSIDLNSESSSEIEVRTKNVNKEFNNIAIEPSEAKPNEWTQSEDVNNSSEDESIVDKRGAISSSNKDREGISSSEDESEEDTVEMNPSFDSEWGGLREELNKTHNGNEDHSNEIDEYDAVPADLSNDIAVNNIAAQSSNFPSEPDSEFVAVMDPTGNKAAAIPEYLSTSSTLNPTSYQSIPAMPDIK